MNNTLFYSSVCPDTEAFVKELDHLEIPYDAVNITESMGNLKKFLKYRDFQPDFESKKETNQVGVPVLLANNSAETRYIFDLNELKNLN